MKKYSQDFLNQILADYPHMSTREVALKYGLTESKVHGIACSRKIKKDPEYMKQMLARTNENLFKYGKAHRYKKGDITWNKGKYMRVSVATEFKKGHKPHNYKPVGENHCGWIPGEEGSRSQEMESSTSHSMGGSQWTNTTPT